MLTASSAAVRLTTIPTRTSSWTMTSPSPSESDPRISIQSLNTDCIENIGAFLDPQDAIHLAATCKPLQQTLGYRYVDATSLLRKNQWGINGDIRTGDTPVYFQQILVLFPNHTHSVVVSGTYRDQGWGNRKGMIYLVQDRPGGRDLVSSIQTQSQAQADSGRASLNSHSQLHSTTARPNDHNSVTDTQYNEARRFNGGTLITQTPVVAEHHETRFSLRIPLLQLTLEQQQQQKQHQQHQQQQQQKTTTRNADKDDIDTSTNTDLRSQCPSKSPNQATFSIWCSAGGGGGHRLEINNLRLWYLIRGDANGSIQRQWRALIKFYSFYETPAFQFQLLKATVKSLALSKQHDQEQEPQQEQKHNKLLQGCFPTTESSSTTSTSSSSSSEIKLTHLPSLTQAILHPLNQVLIDSGFDVQGVDNLNALDFVLSGIEQAKLHEHKHPNHPRSLSQPASRNTQRLDRNNAIGLRGRMLYTDVNGINGSDNDNNNHHQDLNHHHPRMVEQHQLPLHRVRLRPRPIPGGGGGGVGGIGDIGVGSRIDPTTQPPGLGAMRIDPANPPAFRRHIPHFRHHFPHHPPPFLPY